MRILFTGATSFTGMWFARALARDGHAVVAAIRGTEGGYSDLKAQRLQHVGEVCRLAWNVPFGTPEFLALIEREGPFDLLCHHAADAKDYKSPDFDVIGATGANSFGLLSVLKALRAGGCQRVLLTGSVFEADEGAGNAPLRAFSAYGLSKTLTAQIFSFYAATEGLGLGKFVIPNPFGPLEEPRFTDYLLRCWKDGKPARVNTPLYLRDNIPVSLLAAAYAGFAAAVPQSGFVKLNPSFYVESQGAFAQRFAREIGSRLKLEATLELGEQSDFAEPMIRINTDAQHRAVPGWNESAAWDEAAAYYATRFGLEHR